MAQEVIAPAADGAAVADAVPIVPAVIAQPIGPHRPSILFPLYASSAILQGLDYVTTTRALGTGQASEANPVMHGIAGNSAGLLAVKAGTAAATIWMSEKLWKRHRVAAIAMMAGVNATMGVVVSRNMQTLAALR